MHQDFPFQSEWVVWWIVGNGSAMDLCGQDPEVEAWPLHGGSISGDELTWRPPVAGLDLVFTARELRADGREITHQEKDETRALCLHE